MNITVIGSGYQGLAEAAVLSQSYNVKILKTESIDEEVLSQCRDYGIQNLESLIIESPRDALSGSDVIFISLVIPYDIELNMYDKYDVDMYISQAMRYAPDALLVLRSDVPVGYTKRMNNKYPELNMIFVPDFIRERRAIRDVFNPSRLIIGGGDEASQKLVYSILNSGCDVVFTGTDEAESVKLFANVYLAMRVTYFNEMDSFAELRGLNSKDIIRSVSLDPRIGNLYNNPSFGYGGRYLVEGTGRLKNDFIDISHKIVDMVEQSNEERKDYIVSMIMARKPKVCGIYNLSMKAGSKDLNYSVMDGIIRRLQSKGVHVIIFEPMIRIERYLSADVVNDFESFCDKSDVIVANRVDEKIKKFNNKLYTRDIFERE